MYPNKLKPGTFEEISRVMEAALKLPDVQNSGDNRGLLVDKAGIKNVKIPVVIKDQEEGEQHIIGTFTISTDLRSEQRGIHMSRFLEALEDVYGKTVDVQWLQSVLLKRIIELQGANEGFIRMHFDYFVPVIAPISELKSKLPVQCDFIVSTMFKPVIMVKVPVMLVCPCSLEISEKQQAHNQRGYIEMSVQWKEGAFIWIEALVDVANGAASAPVFPLLKRPDEKAITDISHKRPRFVEDAVRNVAQTLKRLCDCVDGKVIDTPITWFRANVESEESIHAHNAFAEIEEGRFE